MTMIKILSYFLNYNLVLSIWIDVGFSLRQNKGNGVRAREFIPPEVKFEEWSSRCTKEATDNGPSTATDRCLGLLSATAALSLITTPLFSRVRATDDSIVLLFPPQW